MRCKVKIILVLFLVSLELKAQVPEYSHHITKAFRITNSITVDIANKYGRIQIIPWEGDSVEFTIDMRIRAKDKQKLEKIKQSVEFEFTPGRYFLVAHTKFGESGSDVIKDLVDIAGSYLSSSNTVTINYTVKIPVNVPLKIENKFGNVFFDDYDGPLTLSLSYGDLKANRLNGRTEIKLTSGDSEVGFLKDGTLFISYSNTHIREAVKLTAQTRSSVITVDKSEAMKLDSRRDKLFLNEIGSLSGACYFSNVNLGILHDNLTLNTRYGDLTVDGIQRAFSLINLTSELTDIALSFEKPWLFNFDLTHQQDVLFMYPKASAKLTTRVFSAEDKLFTTSGTFGFGSPQSSVIIKAPRKCNLTFSQK